MSLYLTGLLLSGGRKTAVGMGRRLAQCDDELESMRQRLQQCVSISDAGFGDATEFRDGLDKRGCPYLVGICGEHLTWPPGSRPRPPKNEGGAGRPRARYTDGRKMPLAISEVGEKLVYKKVTVVGSRGATKSGYFAFERVHLAERHTKGRKPSEELWLIGEWRPAKREYR